MVWVYNRNKSKYEIEIRSYGELGNETSQKSKKGNKMKKVLRIRESELKEAIRNSIKEELGRELLLTEMARVGFMDQGRYEIYVWTDDPGNEPHIHIRDYSTHGEKFETCVKLRTNEYFLHNGYTDMFNHRYEKLLYEFMTQPSKSPKYRNNYECAVEMMNLNNSTAEVEVKEDENGNIIVPRYDNMLK